MKITRIHITQEKENKLKEGSKIENKLVIIILNYQGRSLETDFKGLEETRPAKEKELINKEIE